MLSLINSQMLLHETESGQSTYCHWWTVKCCYMRVDKAHTVIDEQSNAVTWEWTNTVPFEWSNTVICEWSNTVTFKWSNTVIIHLINHQTLSKQQAQVFNRLLFLFFAKGFVHMEQCMEEGYKQHPHGRWGWGSTLLKVSAIWNCEGQFNDFKQWGLPPHGTVKDSLMTLNSEASTTWNCEGQFNTLNSGVFHHMELWRTV